MTRNPRKIVFTSIGIIFFVLVVIFAYGRFGRYIHGPIITQISLKDFQTIENNSLVVNGVVSNVQTMSINGRILALDKDQHFSEHIVVPPGMSTIEITVADTFEKQRNYTYTVYSQNKDINIPRNYIEAMELQEPVEELPFIEIEEDIPKEPEPLTTSNQ